MKLARFTPLIAGALVTATTAFALTPTARVYSDVSSDQANAEAIMYLKEEGVVEGYADGSFRPTATINRAEFVKIMVEARYTDEEIDELLMRVRLSAMPDVPSDSWYWRYVAFARARGIVSGYPDNSFKPSAAINFVEAAKIIANTYELESTEGSVWYEGYVHALANARAIPLSVQSFASMLTRGDMAEIIYRIDAGVTTKSSHTYASLNGDHPADTGGCMRTGCSGQICSDEEMASTCEWREEYQCYKTATCERQDNGQCGWTETEELSSCLAGEGVPTNPCAAVLCPTETRCVDGACVPFEDEPTDASCAAVTCPTNSRCENGACIPLEEEKPVRSCANYTRDGVEQRYCATCGNNVCEKFEKCSASVCNADGMCTKDCGQLYCPQDCE